MATPRDDTQAQAFIDHACATRIAIMQQNSLDFPPSIH
jgi:hypothetical protein